MGTAACWRHMGAWAHRACATLAPIQCARVARVAFKVIFRRSTKRRNHFKTCILRQLRSARAGAPPPRRRGCRVGGRQPARERGAAEVGGGTRWPRASIGAQGRAAHATDLLYASGQPGTTSSQGLSCVAVRRRRRPSRRRRPGADDRCANRPVQAGWLTWNPLMSAKPLRIRCAVGCALSPSTVWRAQLCGTSCCGHASTNSMTETQCIG